MTKEVALEDVELGDPVEVMRLSRAAKRACAVNGIKRIVDLASRTREEVAELTGFTPAIMAEVAGKVEATGLGFSGERAAQVTAERVRLMRLVLAAPHAPTQAEGSAQPFSGSPAMDPSFGDGPAMDLAATDPPATDPSSGDGSAMDLAATDSPVLDAAERPASGTPLADLRLEGLCIRAYNALSRRGIATLEELSLLDEADVMATRSLGRGSFDNLKEVLSRRGVALAVRARPKGRMRGRRCAGRAEDAPTGGNESAAAGSTGNDKNVGAAHVDEGQGREAREVDRLEAEEDHLLRNLVRSMVSLDDWVWIVERARTLALRGEPHARDWLSRAGGFWP